MHVLGQDHIEGPWCFLSILPVAIRYICRLVPDMVGWSYALHRLSNRAVSFSILVLDMIGWSYAFHRLPIRSVSFSIHALRPTDQRIWSPHPFLPIYVSFNLLRRENFVPLAAKAVFAAWLSVQITFSFISIFFLGGGRGGLQFDFNLPVS